jgi:aminoglycoside 3-N-acetyltransferase
MYLDKFIDKLRIKKNDTLLITGNTIKLLRKIKKDNKKFDFSIFIDKLKEKLGKNGTLIIQTFNWDFCQNKTYDIINSKSQTGAIGNVALKRSDFKRTKHPIYSFAVSGKYQNQLSEVNNIGAFDKESVFNFIHKIKAKMIIIDLPLQNSFTFVHHVEEIEQVSYRYNKQFTSKYINEEGIEMVKTYDMYVRDIENNVLTYIEPLEDLFIQHNVMSIYNIDEITIRQIDLSKAYHIIEDDIRNNNAKSLYKIGES